MDRDINSEEHSEGEILTTSLSAEVSSYASCMSPTSLLRYSPHSINNIAGSSENLSYNNLSKTVLAGGTLSGDLMLGVVQPHGTRIPFILQFYHEKGGTYAYNVYAISSLSVGDQVVQCRHLDSISRSGQSRYLSGQQYISGRDSMPLNQPIELSAMTSPSYPSGFQNYLSSAIKTAESKLS